MHPDGDQSLRSEARTALRCGLCVYLCLALSMSVCRAANLVVAPDGRDDNPGTPDRPLASLAGARDAVRRTLASGTDGHITVLIRGGVYRLQAPVVFGPNDSARRNATVTYAAWPGETPVFSGGQQITGWRRNGRTWTAPVADATGGVRIFRCLYVGDQRRTLARSPNSGEYFRMLGPAGKPPGRAFEFEEGDVRDWPRIGAADVVALIKWESCAIPITGVDTGTCTVTLAGSVKWPLLFENGVRYFVENLPEALDAPGEWFLDRQAGMLSYVPLPGESTGDLDATAPVATRLLVLDGKPGQPVSGLVFRGLCFRHADYALEATGQSGPQAAERVSAAVTFAHAVGCRFEQGEIVAVGGYAIEVGPGCSGIRIEGSELRNTGAGGIKVRSGSAGTTIHNNFIHDGGSVHFGGTPVLIQDSGHNVVTHNEICDFNWSGICVGWSWGFQPTGCHSNRIEYNHLHHLGRGVLTDIGAIYTLGISTGTSIRNNLIHHVWDCPEGYLACGIYPDEGSTGLLIESNIVYQTSWGGLHVHYGRDNVIRNNIFAFGRSAQIHMGRARSAGDGANWLAVTNSSMTFERNVILYESGSLFMRDSELTADSNLYWSTGGPVVFPGGADLGQWRARGRDAHAIVDDPRFVDAAQGDFRLQPGSPALAAGFSPVDITKAGLVGDPAWVSRPTMVKREATVIPAHRPLNVVDAIDDDFEKGGPGALPRHAAVQGANADAWIRTTGAFAAGGSRSLEFRDAPTVANSWDPHMFYTLALTGGTVSASFEVRIAPGAAFSHEWRDWTTNPYVVGPSLALTADGTLSANGRPLAALPAEQWVGIHVACRLGERADGAFTVTVAPRGQPPTTYADLACDRRFTRLTWLGFCSTATTKQAFYLDNLSVQRK